jgi:hypothetical protein
MNIGVNFSLVKHWTVADEWNSMHMAVLMPAPCTTGMDFHRNGKLTSHFNAVCCFNCQGLENREPVTFMMLCFNLPNSLLTL